MKRRGNLDGKTIVETMDKNSIKKNEIDIDNLNGSKLPDGYKILYDTLDKYEFFNTKCLEGLGVDNIFYDYVRENYQADCTTDSFITRIFNISSTSDSKIAIDNRSDSYLSLGSIVGINDNTNINIFAVDDNDEDIDVPITIDIFKDILKIKNCNKLTTDKVISELLLKLSEV